MRGGTTGHERGFMGSMKVEMIILEQQRGGGGGKRERKQLKLLLFEKMP